MSNERNRATVRRAWRAGGAVAIVVAGAGVVVTLAAGVAATAVVVTVALSLGAMAASAWLLLAALLDVLAGEPPDGRRWAWTVAATLLAMLGPFFVLGALSQVATVGAAA